MIYIDIHMAALGAGLDLIPDDTVITNPTLQQGLQGVQDIHRLDARQQRPPSDDRHRWYRQ